MSIKYFGHPDQLPPPIHLKTIDEHPPIISNQLRNQMLRNPSNQPLASRRTISAITNQPMQNIVTAGKQNRSPLMPYKKGVRTIYGIPYTLEEQRATMTLNEIQNKIIELCRDQHRNPDLSEIEQIKRFKSFDGMQLPDANDLISYSVRMSPKIGNHP